MCRTLPGFGQLAQRGEHRGHAAFGVARPAPKEAAIFDPGAGAITDPDAIEGHAGLPSVSSAQKIAAGRTVAVELAVTV